MDERVDERVRELLGGKFKWVKENPHVNKGELIKNMREGVAIELAKEDSDKERRMQVLEGYSTEELTTELEKRSR